MKYIILTLALTWVSQSLFGQVHYAIGDTLYVVALGRTNLREYPDKGSQKITKLDNGHIVLVSELTTIKEKIEFDGHWVKVSSVSTGQSGFVFDNFVSRFKVIQKLQSASAITDLEAFGDQLPKIITEYAIKTFNGATCNMHYDNGIDGETYHGFDIKQFSNGAKLIEHSYWESSQVELELYNARDSEVYYLIKNILKQIDSKYYSINEGLIANPKNTSWKCEVTTNTETTDYACLIDVKYKGENITSIYFKYHCC